MDAPPVLPPRNHSYEVRLEPLESDLHEEHRALASGVYFTLVRAKLFTNNPAITGVKAFLTCELHGESESSYLSDGESLAPEYGTQLCVILWRKPFKIVVDKDDRSKLILRLYEQYSPDHVICLGAVELHTYQISYFVGALRSFPLDPVSRQEIPDDCLARYLLVLRSYLQIEFTEIKPEIPPEVITTDPLQLRIPSVQAISTTLPPLPPRRTDSPSQLQTTGPPPLPPRSHKSSVTIVQETIIEEGDPNKTKAASTILLVSANNTPAPIVPKQSLFSRISNYIAGSSSPPQIDVWYHRMIESDQNHFLEFESLYYAYETEGHATRMKKHKDMSDYVYLYVPGLYSGKHPWSKRTDKPPNSALSEPIEPSDPQDKPTSKHHERISFLKGLGLDARIVPVPNDGQVVSNAHLIAESIRNARKETGKYVILIGYSKGGVDSTAALSLNPDLAQHIRCLITMFSPLYGSHIAADIDDSMLGSVVYMAIKKIMECGTEAMKDLSFISRSDFLHQHPFDERVPTLSLASAVTTSAKTSTFQVPYKYILSKYAKENDGLVACQDAIFPGAPMILIPAMDHVGPRPEYPVYRNHVSFILALIESALSNTQYQWFKLCQDLGQPSSNGPSIPFASTLFYPNTNDLPPLPPRRSPSTEPPTSVTDSEVSHRDSTEAESTPHPSDDFHRQSSSEEQDLISFTDISSPLALGNNPFIREDLPDYDVPEPVDLPLPLISTSPPPQATSHTKPEPDSETMY